MKLRQSKIGRKYGYRPDRINIRDTVYRPLTPKMEIQIPQSVNLMEKVPLVAYDQLSFGACTGNAVAQALNFIRPNAMPSRLMLYFNARAMEGDPFLDNGAQISDVVTALAEEGVCPEIQWPYDSMDLLTKPSEQDYQNALANKVSQYMRVGDLDDTKQCLAEGFPVVIGFTVYDNLESDEVAKTGILHLPGPNDEMIGGHAVLAVGYDETRQQVYIINSWGNWGLNGFFWMDYSYFQNLVSDCWTIRG